MNRLLIASLALVALLLGACSQQDAASGVSKPNKQELSVQTLATKAKGFTVGSMMSANTIYVFFDPQCPHCGHLWRASLPLHSKVKFVWIPVAWINASSLPQGAALLTAANPTEVMTAHETSLLAGKGGLSASAGVASDIEQAIKSNTQLLNGFGAESVPYVVTQDARTGQTVGRSGAMGTPQLAALAGLDTPAP